MRCVHVCVCVLCFIVCCVVCAIVCLVSFFPRHTVHWTRRGDADSDIHTRGRVGPTCQRTNRALFGGHRCTSRRVHRRRASAAGAGEQHSWCVCMLYRMEMAGCCFASQSRRFVLARCGEFRSLNCLLFSLSLTLISSRGIAPLACSGCRSVRANLQQRFSHSRRQRNRHEHRRESGDGDTAHVATRPAPPRPCRVARGARAAATSSRICHAPRVCACVACIEIGGTASDARPCQRKGCK